MSRVISLAIKNAPALPAYVAAPRGEGPFPAVIVFHDAFGVNAQMRSTADKLARDGFVAVVPELFHRTAPEGFEARPYQASLVKPHVNALKQEWVEVAMQAVHKWIANQDYIQADKTASLGFSMGGRYSFIANEQLKLAAGVSFYGGMLHKEASRANGIRRSHLFVWAGRDEHISRDQSRTVTEAMLAAGKDYSCIEIARAAHGFFFDGYPGYDAGAARETWGFVKEYLKNELQ